MFQPFFFHKKTINAKSSEIRMPSSPAPSHHTHIPAQPLQITKTNLKTKGKQRKPSPVTSTNFSPGFP